MLGAFVFLTQRNIPFFKRAGASKMGEEFAASINGESKAETDLRS
jgi:hypothetical protein